MCTLYNIQSIFCTRMKKINTFAFLLLETTLKSDTFLTSSQLNVNFMFPKGARSTPSLQNKKIFL